MGDQTACTSVRSTKCEFCGENDYSGRHGWITGRQYTGSSIIVECGQKNVPGEKGYSFQFDCLVVHGVAVVGDEGFDEVSTMGDRIRQTEHCPMGTLSVTPTGIM